MRFYTATIGDSGSLDQPDRKALAIIEEKFNVAVRAYRARGYSKRTAIGAVLTMLEKQLMELYPKSFEVGGISFANEGPNTLRTPKITE